MGGPGSGRKKGSGGSKKGKSGLDKFKAEQKQKKRIANLIKSGGKKA